MKFCPKFYHIWPHKSHPYFVDIPMCPPFKFERIKSNITAKEIGVQFLRCIDFIESKCNAENSWFNDKNDVKIKLCSLTPSNTSNFLICLHIEDCLWYLYFHQRSINFDLQHIKSINDDLKKFSSLNSSLKPNTICIFLLECNSDGPCYNSSIPDKIVNEIEEKTGIKKVYKKNIINANMLTVSPKKIDKNKNIHINIEASNLP
ncbi:hypothetical protein [Treponema pedis]|uniref:hypothetical protein n=2 Tax=Treponema pedis TaxID=409322 RepID=UPI003D1E0A31